VLGDDIEHGALELTLAGTSTRTVIRLPQERVFEDTEPRVVDLDGDGAPEVVVVEAHRDVGARLAIYTATGLLAATPYIGTRNRWLAPIAVADLDGDGVTELAYIYAPIWPKPCASGACRMAASPRSPLSRVSPTTASGSVISQRDCATAEAAPK
jgi:hypothetical protein